MTVYIAIVGGGPKGMYGLERLVAQLAARPLPHGRKVEIHIFNHTTHFGSGGIYRPDQPHFLVMNYAAGNVNMWIDESPASVVPNPLDFVDWASEQAGEPFDPMTVPARAYVGRYLRDGFETILENVPDGVIIKPIVGSVKEIEEGPEGYRIYLEDERFMELKKVQYAHVLLATGHPRNNDSELDQLFAFRHEKVVFVPFVYPVKNQLYPLPADEVMFVRGMGLTFIDTVLALTEGRGGRFERVSESNERLRYIPSGREPSVIYPFSRSGIPILPRAPYVGDDSLVPLKFFTDELVEEFLARDEKVDFVTEIWPLIKQDMVYAYYRVWMAEVDGTELPGDSYEEIEAQIEQFHKRHPLTDRFHVEQFLDPLGEDHGMCQEELNLFVRGYVSNSLEAAVAGEDEHPIAAVTAVWRHATDHFRRVYCFGGLTPASQKTFTEDIFSGLSRITFGPPASSIRKVLALAECGLIDFGLSHRGELERDERAGIFRLSSGEGTAEARVLIDARIPKVSITANDSPIYTQMIESGLARLYTNRYKGHEYKPGCIEISRQGFVINKQGEETRIALTGTPTEGVVFDNDSLSRHCNNFVSGWARIVHEDITERRTNYDKPFATPLNAAHI